MKDFVARFVRDEPGGAIEYGLIAALIAVAIIGAAGAFGTQIATFNTVVTEMRNSERTTP